MSFSFAYLVEGIGNDRLKIKHASLAYELLDNRSQPHRKEPWTGFTEKKAVDLVKCASINQALFTAL